MHCPNEPVPPVTANRRPETVRTTNASYRHTQVGISGVTITTPLRDLPDISDFLLSRINRDLQPVDGGSVAAHNGREYARDLRQFRSDSTGRFAISAI